MRPVGPMLYSSTASCPPFWMSDFPGHVITNETSFPPLCWSCGLIPDIHLPNYVHILYHTLEDKFTPLPCHTIFTQPQTPSWKLCHKSLTPSHNALNQRVSPRLVMKITHVCPAFHFLQFSIPPSVFRSSLCCDVINMCTVPYCNTFLLIFRLTYRQHISCHTTANLFIPCTWMPPARLIL